MLEIGVLHITPIGVAFSVAGSIVLLAALEKMQKHLDRINEKLHRWLGLTEEKGKNHMTSAEYRYNRWVETMEARNKEVK